MSTPEDRTGQNRLLRNLASGWAAHFLQVISGFILPRLISDRLGQGSLGVWDFGWAVVSYFALLQGGIVSSVNRYVSRHRSTSDWHKLNVAVNSVGCVLKAIAIVIAILTVLIAWFLPELLQAKLAGLSHETRWVVLCLGLTAAVQVQGAVYGGVLTGCHRWTTQNGIKTMAAIFSVVVSVIAILLGGSIISVAAVMLASELLMRSAQRIAARRHCPELVMSVRLFSRAQAIEMCRFGGKSYVNVIGQMLINQTASVIVASTFGVAALAVFNRPRTLLRAFSSVIESNALVVVPTVSALQADDRLAEVRRLAIAGARYAAFACFPALLFLLTLGGDVLRLWMGHGYDDAVLLAIFAISGLLQAAYIPLYRVLMGLNRHGRLGLLNIACAVVTVLLVVTMANLFQSQLRWIALAICVPSVVVNAIILPHLLAASLHMKAGELLRSIWWTPIWTSLPAGAAFLLTSLYIPGPALLRIVVGATAGLIASGPLYWRHMVPAQVKSVVFRLLGRGGVAGPRPTEASVTADRRESVTP